MIDNAVRQPKFDGAKSNGIHLVYSVTGRGTQQRMKFSAETIPSVWAGPVKTGRTAASRGKQTQTIARWSIVAAALSAPLIWFGQSLM
jgi:hypothetical protein